MSAQAAETGFADAYHIAETGASCGAAAVSFDDSAWETVSIPHDAAVKGDLDMSQSDYGGFLKRPDTWYRRVFTLEDAEKGRRQLLQFDGVTGRTDVYLNGAFLLRSESDAAGFCADVTDVVRFDGAPNVLALRSEHSVPTGWWYEGAGIYRDARLISTGTVGILDDSVRVTSAPGQDGVWRLDVSAELTSVAEGGSSATLEVCVREGEAVVGRARADVSIAECGTAKVHLTLSVPHPKLWDVGQ